MEDQEKYCDNCDRVIKHNAELHILSCKKYNKLCTRCQEPVRIEDMKEHLVTMHTIEVCDFCKKPFEKWELEGHKNVCRRKPVECKFCNLEVADDDFQEHANACWNRTDKCAHCAQYVKLKDMETHEKACQNPSMMNYVICKYCEEPFSLHVIETHESVCVEKNIRCPDCGDLIKKYKNNHACKGKKNSSNVLPGEVKRQDRIQENSTSPFNNNYHSPNNFPEKNSKNQAVELSPPDQRDLSDPKLFRGFRERNPDMPTRCNFCGEYMIPNEIRIHPEICRMRPEQCELCEKRVPFCHLRPELHRCSYSTSVDHEYESKVGNVHGMQEKYASDYRESSNLSKEDPKVQTQDCPLCLKTFPVDRFNNHVRACADGKQFCYFCKNNFFGEMKEHLKQCTKKEPETKKGSKKKQNNEKNEGIFSRGMNYIFSNQKKGKKGHKSSNASDLNPAENQLVIDGIPCEICNELYPFAEIAVHELGCLHEKEMKTNASMKKPKDEVPQASGYTPFNPRDYMPTDDYENKGREPRNQRFSQRGPNDESPKFPYSKPYQGYGNSRNHQSDAFRDDFYEKHLVKDHEKDISAARPLKEPRKTMEEGKKKDVIFKFSSERENKIPVKEEKRLQQGARPKGKYQVEEYVSKHSSGYKGLNCFSDTDEETDLCLSKLKEVELKNKKSHSSAVNSVDSKLNAIGSERKEKKSIIEIENNNSCISIENENIPVNFPEDASSSVGNKKGSFNSESSEEVYVSCDEGDEFPETNKINKDGKKMKKEERGDKPVQNSSSEKIRQSNKKDGLPIQGVSMDELDRYSKEYKDADILKSEENIDKEQNSKKGSLSGTEDKFQESGINLDEVGKYLNEYQNRKHHIKATDTMTSNRPTILPQKETKSILHKFMMDEDVDMEIEEDKKNEETFANDSRIGPFEAMTNSQFSYETLSSLPPYSSIDSVCPNNSAVDIKSDDNLTSDLDAYLQFLGVDDPEPVANYRLFEGNETYKTKPTEPDLSYGYLKNDQLDASNANNPETKMISVPKELSVQAEELKGVSKNMPSYTSPFLLGNELEEGESVIITERKFPVPLEEKNIKQVAEKSSIEVKAKSQEEKDNEFNFDRLKWRSTRQISCESDE